MATMYNPIQSGLVFGFSVLFDSLFDALGVPDPNHVERQIKKQELDWQDVDKFMKQHNLGSEDDLA